MSCETIWQRIYTPTIRAALRSRLTRWATVGIAFGLFIVSLSLVPLLPTAFIDAGGEPTLTVTIAPPPGASSDAVIETAAEAEAILLADPEVEHIQSTIPRRRRHGRPDAPGGVQRPGGEQRHHHGPPHDGVDLAVKTGALGDRSAPSRPMATPSRSRSSTPVAPVATRHRRERR